MGYDYPECIGCYCIDGMNEDSRVNIKICIDCFREFTSLTGRARVYAEEVYNNNILCEVCGKEGEGYKDIPLCENHNNELLKKK